MSDAWACARMRGNGNVSTFMSKLLDDLVSVHRQGSEEATTNASAQTTNDGLDLLHK